MSLIVVSNRVSIAKTGDAAQGGLAAALSEALRLNGGTWLGWSGDISEEPGNELKMSTVGGVTYGLIDLTAQDYDEYYTGFANRSLWPLMHYRLGLTEFSPGDFTGYKRVNTAFAKHLASLAGPDDKIWVHDYHLMPLARELRRLGLVNPMGYFHHIPWPPPEVFGILPAARQLLRAMLDYDVVGLQTDVDRDHFCQCLVREIGAVEIGIGGFQVDGRFIRVIALPIGIDAAAMAAAAVAASSNPDVADTIASLSGRDLILGVDRLDYSKGVARRMEAYGLFLNDHPERRTNVEYLQITPISRAEIPEYEQINQEVAETAGRLNGALGEASWIPIRYVNRSYPRDVLAGLYRAARVCLVTPMRDGMNLVAKEFVAAQDPENPGVLVLSRFAGARHQLKQALIVNPYDRSDVAGMIEQGLSMPLKERQERFAALHENVAAFDISWWVQGFLAVLAQVRQWEGGPAAARFAVPPPKTARTRGNR
jgi:trehalose 6-phosphate synthase